MFCVRLIEWHCWYYSQFTNHYTQEAFLLDYIQIMNLLLQNFIIFLDLFSGYFIYTFMNSSFTYLIRIVFHINKITKNMLLITLPIFYYLFIVNYDQIIFHCNAYLHIRILCFLNLSVCFVQNFSVIVVLM